MLTAHATVLLVDDVEVAGDYYQDKLGFEVTYFDKNPSHYAYANRGEVWMHFACFADAGPEPNSVAVPPDMFDAYVYVDDVDALHAELAERGAEIIGVVTDTEYGCREFRVRDPDGYILAFGKVLS
jgi:catechol 2,3-dioxygenase-like lactoylglutathione lyase family enzyme